MRPHAPPGRPHNPGAMAAADGAMAADGLTQLERERLRRIEENRRRMAEMVGPMEQYDALM